MRSKYYITICIWTVWIVSHTAVFADVLTPIEPEDVFAEPVGRLSPIERFKDDGSIDYLNYKIPGDVDRIGPIPQRLYSKPFVIYYLSREPKRIIAKEYLDRYKNLISRELFLDWDKHGIERWWYPNGQLKAEHPYKNGVMHGTFREWDEHGILVAMTKFHAGTGVFKRYYSNRRLKEQIPYERNLQHGTILFFYPNGQLKALCRRSKGVAQGDSMAFFENGQLKSWAHCNTQGQLHGPIVRFDDKGDLEKINYYITGGEVDLDKYSMACPIDSTLPKILASPAMYREQVITAEIKQLIEKYCQQKPILLPLEREEENR